MTETPEQKARREIDANLEAAGWRVQGGDEYGLTAARTMGAPNSPILRQ